MRASKPSRLRLLAEQLIELRRMRPGAQIRPFPELRNVIVDVLALGRRKNIFHIVFDVDISDARKRWAEHRARTGVAVSLTSYLAQAFARAVAADRRMQAYRFGRSRLVIFDDVDLCAVIERECDGELQPIWHIVRAAQDKSAQDIYRELQWAKHAELGASGPLKALELQFFRLPRPLRRIAWFFIRRNPFTFKSLAGTVLITSYGQHTAGAAVGLPITPMTLTLTVGAIEKRAVIENGSPVEREILHLNLSVDHDIIDGALAMRFVQRLKSGLQVGSGETAPADPVHRTAAAVPSS